MTDVVFDDTKMGTTKNGFDGVTDIADWSTGANLIDSGPESKFGGFDEIFNGRIGFTDGHSESGISVISLIENDEVKRNFITVGEDVIAVGGAVNELFVDRNTNGARKFFRKKIVGDDGAAFSDFLSDPLINLALGYACGCIIF